MGAKKVNEYFISVVFIESGKLIDIHKDRAVEAGY